MVYAIIDMGRTNPDYVHVRSPVRLNCSFVRFCSFFLHCDQLKMSTKIGKPFWRSAGEHELDQGVHRFKTINFERSANFVILLGAISEQNNVCSYEQANFEILRGQGASISGQNRDSTAVKNEPDLRGHHV